jgi:hypothetical protein
MKVSGFTIVRNVLKFDYPAKEAIMSVLPFCDEFIVAVGNSEDDTLNLIKSIGSPKIKIIETLWDESLREGGKVLAQETDKALSAISKESDWAFYIQADEVIHEKYYDNILKFMKLNLKNKEVEGLLFNYKHFYADYGYLGDSRRWYRKEIRIIRNDPSIKSYKDAQGFRKGGRKLKVKPIDAYIYHYGWVKPPKEQQEKQKYFNKLWHDDQWMEQNIGKDDEFDYSKVDSLVPFTGTHPEVMKNRIGTYRRKLNFDPGKKNFSLKEKTLRLIERITGYRIGEYKNYKILR